MARIVTDSTPTKKLTALPPSDVAADTQRVKKAPDVIARAQAKDSQFRLE
jgi:hypothetical protein